MSAVTIHRPADDGDPTASGVRAQDASTHIAAGDASAVDAAVLRAYICAAEWAPRTLRAGGTTWVLTHDGHEDATYHSRQSLINRAERCLGAHLDAEAGSIKYYAEETGTWWVCDDQDDIVELGRMLADPDQQDAYSHWCAGTSHEVQL